MVHTQQTRGVARVQDSHHAVRARPLLPEPVMEPLLVYPDPPPVELAQTLDLNGYAWKPIGDERAAQINEPDDGWAGAIVSAHGDTEGAFALCRTLRKRDVPLAPLLLLIPGSHLQDLELRNDLFDDFCLSPFHPRELEAR